MGGDNGPSVTVPAALAALQRDPDRVGVVAMSGEGAAAEPGAEQLDAVDRATPA